jgi:hypothetical protein
MVINFIPTGPRHFASSRFRAYWVAEHIKGSRVSPPIYISEEESRINAIEADVYIWQKFVETGFMRSKKDSRHVWDICDPLWWFTPEKSREIIGLCSDFVCCTQPLADDFERWSGLKAHVIPDRMKLEHFTTKRVHEHVDTVKMIWFGMSVNRGSLMGAWANIARLAANGHKVSLTIMDDTPHIPLGFGGEIDQYYVPWSLRWEVEILAQHDIALLPPYPGPWGKLKSNNKLLTAWGTGLPVTSGHDYEEMVNLVKNPTYRAAMAYSGHEELTKNYDVREVKIVCSTTENYLEKTKEYLSTVNKYSAAENIIVTVEFVPDIAFFKELPHINWINMSEYENRGSPEGTKSIQHGSFVDLVSDHPEDTLVYTDCDIYMQRPFSNVEMMYLEGMKEGTVSVGWNSGPEEKLIHEAMRLQPKVSPEELRKQWGTEIDTEPCFNIGVMAATNSTWKKIYRLYMENWQRATEIFGHRARQQWLVCWAMARLQLNRQIMPYTMHTHAHYGLPRGTYIYGNGVAGYEDKIILFRHRF